MSNEGQIDRGIPTNQAALCKASTTAHLLICKRGLMPAFSPRCRWLHTGSSWWLCERTQKAFIHSILSLSMYILGVPAVPTLMRSFSKAKWVQRATQLVGTQPKRPILISLNSLLKQLLSEWTWLSTVLASLLLLNPSFLDSKRLAPWKKKKSWLGRANTTTQQACLWGVHGVKWKHWILTHHTQKSSSSFSFFQAIHSPNRQISAFL